MSRLLPVIGGAAAGAVIAAVIASGSSSHSTVTTTVVKPSAGTSIPSSFTPSKGMTINQIYRAASPGVVDLKVTSVSNNGFGFGGQQQGEGAGVVYDTKGNILTDEHVVAGATKVTVNFQNGRSASGKVLGTDPSTDVAVVHVNVPASQLHPIPFADSSTAQVGDPVVAIGSPFSLPETTTTGIVSAVGRPIQAPNRYEIPGAIQTDAAINPGNSGGPLLDANAHVLGLNDQIQTNSGQSAGVGFATPANSVRRVADAIIAGHPVRHAYVGVSLSGNSTGGARIGSVQSNSPATRAGLQAGDLITAVDGKKVTSTDQFIATVDQDAPGQSVTITVNRGGQVKNISVTLGTRPASAPNGG